MLKSMLRVVINSGVDGIITNYNYYLGELFLLSGIIPDLRKLMPKFLVIPIKQHN